MALDPSLARSIETLSARFPHLDRDVVDRCVHRAYEQLRASATVTNHLVTLAERQAAEELAALDEAGEPR